MRERFKQYLIEHGYKQYTPSGNPSTVYDYIKRIDRVCEWEGYSDWSELSSHISTVLPEYDTGGSKETYGKKSHHAVINALRRFSEFSAA